MGCKLARCNICTILVACYCNMLQFLSWKNISIKIQVKMQPTEGAYTWGGNCVYSETIYTNQTGWFYITLPYRVLKGGPPPASHSIISDEQLLHTFIMWRGPLEQSKKLSFVWMFAKIYSYFECYYIIDFAFFKIRCRTGLMLMVFLCRRQYFCIVVTKTAWVAFTRKGTSRNLLNCEFRSICYMKSIKT